MSMKICEDGHEEVCFNSFLCPVCLEERKRAAVVVILKTTIQYLKEAKGENEISEIINNIIKSLKLVFDEGFRDEREVFE
jgi:hypothetical protein